VCKLSALAFCYKDGGEDSKALSKDQQARVVQKLPSVLEITSYTYYISNSALGVFFEFSDYKRFIERTNEYKNVPSPVLVSLHTLVNAVVFTGAFVICSQWFYLSYCYDSAYMSHSFWYRIMYLNLGMTVRRFFYYGPFLFTTGAIQASGLGYNGNGKWDKVIGVYWKEIEFGTSVIELLRAWNHQVHLWLKFYVQCRLVDPGQRATFAQSMITFIVSAFWHGFYPSYYIMFFFAAILSEVNKDIFKAQVIFQQYIPK
jgi:lysophospholipid acyltransferase